MSTPNTFSSTYDSGDCRIITYTNDTHELWHAGVYVAVFKSFRSAVRYQLSEFPEVGAGG